MGLRDCFVVPPRNDEGGRIASGYCPRKDGRLESSLRVKRGNLQKNTEIASSFLLAMTKGKRAMTREGGLLRAIALAKTVGWYRHCERSAAILIPRLCERSEAI